MREPRCLVEGVIGTHHGGDLESPRDVFLDASGLEGKRTMSMEAVRTPIRSADRNRNQLSCLFLEVVSGRLIQVQHGSKEGTTSPHGGVGFRKEAEGLVNGILDFRGAVDSRSREKLNVGHDGTPQNMRLRGALSRALFLLDESQESPSSYGGKGDFFSESRPLNGGFHPIRWNVSLEGPRIVSTMRGLKGTGGLDSFHC